MSYMEGSDIDTNIRNDPEEQLRAVILRNLAEHRRISSRNEELAEVIATAIQLEGLTAQPGTPKSENFDDATHRFGGFTHQRHAGEPDHYTMVCTCGWSYASFSMPETIDRYVQHRIAMLNIDTSDTPVSGAKMIEQERQRQIDVEGWTPDHDARQVPGDLIMAAKCYATVARDRILGLGRHPDDIRIIEHWPWERSWWKPTHDPVRMLAKAGALIAAEIDRLTNTKETHQ